MGFITDSKATDTTTSATTYSQRQVHEFSILHIILIAFGGVVFLIGIIVIVVLLKSRKKLCANNTSPSRRHARQSPIFVIGHNSRQSRGGDNPAFCGTDEGANGGPPFARHTPYTASQTRLPTYEEVMSGRVPTSPLSSSHIRTTPRHHQPQPPSPPSSSSLSSSSSTTQPPPQPQQRNQPPAGRSSDPEAVPRSQNETPPPRYAYEYPSCFWEEVPPPPYSTGNCGIVRAMGGPRGSARSVESREGASGLRVHSSAPCREVRIISTSAAQNLSPHAGRAPLAVPTPTVLSPAQSPALPPRNHTLSSSGRAAVSGSVASPPPLPAFSSLDRNCRPLASSSPALPRRQLTPSAVPVLTQYLLQSPLMSSGGLQNGTPPMPRLERSRLGGNPGQGQCCRNAMGRAMPAAPIARFDIEL